MGRQPAGPEKIADCFKRRIRLALEDCESLDVRVQRHAIVQACGPVATISAFSDVFELLVSSGTNDRKKRMLD